MDDDARERDDEPTRDSAGDRPTSDAADGTGETRLHAPLLYLTVLVIATSGLVYELLAGTVASYVLGDSVTQFSTTIGVYLFAMGLGSYLSRFVETRLARRFLEVELAAALVGGFSAPLLFLAFAYADVFEVFLYGELLIIGALVGLEIPLLMRILKEQLDFKDLVARVLTFDYIGALVGSLAFALVLVPSLGLQRTSLLVGMLNACVALLGSVVLARLLAPRERLYVRVAATLLLVALAAGLGFADRFTRFTEATLYPDPILHARQSAYQRLVVTHGATTRLYLNGNLQFDSGDEHRYHEALVHPAFAAHPRAARVLILGGGDGLALREVLKHPVEEVTLVDLDPAVTDLARTLPAIRRLHGGVFDDERLTLVNDDAMVWLDEREGPPFDLVLVDFPDPNDFSLGKLYTRRFYRLVQEALAADGVLAVQSTSPLYARHSYWCIERTIRAAGFHTQPYHATVPSFGAWGYVLARPVPFDAPRSLGRDLDLRYLDDATLGALFVFPRDMARVDEPPNRLDDQHLVRLYEREWRAAP